MWVNKIIYVTPGESHLGELTSAAESQLRKVAHNVLGWDIGDSPKTFRVSSENSPLTGDTLFFFSNKCRELTVTNDIWEHLYNNLLSNPWDVDEIITSTKKWEIAVVGVTQKELKNILDSLKENWYDVIDKKEINHRTNIYTVTIDPNDKKKSSFFKAVWWQS